MGLMSTVVAFAGKAKRLSGFVSPDCVPPCLLDAMASSGPAVAVETQPKPDGLVQLQTRRAVLLSEAQRLRNLRRSKEASICEAELHTVTHHLMWLEARK